MTTVEDALRSARDHHRAGRRDVAERLYRQVLSADPAQTPALVLLGTLLLETGRLPEATALFVEDARRKPNDVGAHLALGALLEAQGALADAAHAFERVVALSPVHAVALARLGNLARARGDLSAAVHWFSRAVAAGPDVGDVRNALAAALIDAGRAGEAVAPLRDAIARQPARADLHYHLGLAQSALGQVDEAVASYERAVAANPAFAEAYNNLGGALKTSMRLDEAAAAFEKSLAIRPDAAGVLGNLAGVHEWQARHDDAVACHTRAMALDPSAADLHGSYLFTLLFHPDRDATALRLAHDAWNRTHGARWSLAAAPHDVDRTPERRLRVGYVCGLFRDHVLGRYLMPLLREHDRATFDVVCYSNNRIDDAVTARFRAVASEWHDIARLSDDAAAARIRADRIDILVDTTVHMEGNRLPVFARRPAPVQVTFAGYPGSTGLDAVDHRLTDVHLDPPGLHDDRYVERSWRLPHTFWCYDPLGEDATPGPLPADAAGDVTFGCLNNFSKVNDRMLALWAAVLRAVPRSRLLLLSPRGSHRDRTVAVFATFDIAPDRIAFADYRPRSAYLALYRQVDIALDTVPYNGHTTSLDALWMGVPVVTLVGETVVGRAGLSQLTNVGLTDLVAGTPAEYVTIAQALAADRDRLRRLRGTLRDRMTQSPLMDAKRFAADIEAAYRGMWRRRCAS